MLVSSTGKDQILFPSGNGVHPLKCPDRVDQFFPNKDRSKSSSPFPAICTDVDLAPEYQRSDVERLISGLEEEIAGLRLKLNHFDQKRREALNKLLDLKGSIRVYCRIRPFLWSDRKAIHEPISAGPEKILVRSVSIRKEFEFDKVFTQSSAQEDVFVEVEPILRSALDGHNVCILAYGQTGTGKTFTMEGTIEQQGIVPRAFKELFRQADLNSCTAPTFSMSMLEVYMGSLKDLLARKPSHRVYEPVSRCNLNIQMDPKGAVEIEGLSNVPISDLNKATWWYNRGRRARSTSCTNVNDMSSRSHCLTRITIVQHGDEAKVSKLWMVDLGGSERLLKTGARGQTLDEGRAINLSLSALGDVIASLRRRRNHIPYRNSKLTQILRDSVGDGSKVLMLVHVSPCDEDVAETICSLSFAKRARAIESIQVSSEEIKTQRVKRMVELADEMKTTEEEYTEVQDQLKKAEFLLNENKKLFSSINLLHSNINDEANNDNDNSPRGAKEDLLEETTRSPHIQDKRTRRHSIPRFMTSTVASRQRQSSSEKELYTRAMRSLRSVTTTRSSIQLSCSQSIGHMANPRLKSLHENTNLMRKPRELTSKNVGNDHTAVCSDADVRSSSTPFVKNMVAAPSNPHTGGAKVGWHRRRMSALI